MNVKLRKFLEQHGLAPEASAFEAAKYWAALTGPPRAQADALATAGAPVEIEPPAGDPPAEPSAPEPTAPAADPATAAEPAASSMTSVLAPSSATVTVQPQAVEPVEPTNGDGAPVDPAAAERERVVGIQGIAAQAHLGLDFVAQHTRAGTSLLDTQAAALASLAGSAPPVAVVVGNDLNVDSLGTAIEDALSLRAGCAVNGQVIDEDPMYPATAGQLSAVLSVESRGEYGARTFAAGRRKPHPRAREFQGRRIIQVARQWLASVGIDAANAMGDLQVAELCFNRQAIAQHLGGFMMAHSTSDFPHLLANVANKTLRQAYVEHPVTWPTWARPVTNADLKAIDRVAFGEAGNLSVVVEGDEYTAITVGETKETYNLAKYGKTFTLTLETLINDDLDAMSRLPTMLGRAARRTEDVVAFGIITANAALADGTALFHGDHSNLVTSGGTPTTARISALSALLAKQTGISSDALLNIQPAILMAPVALRQTVLEILTSTADPAGTHSGVANIWQGQLIPVFHPLLDADSTAKWYLLADNGQVDTVELAMLEGAQQPAVSSVENISVDGRTYKVRHWIAAKAIDYRGMAQDDGVT